MKFILTGILLINFVNRKTSSIKTQKSVTVFI